MVKTFYKSKTILVNAIVAVVLGLFGIEAPLDGNMTILLFGLVNIGLRAMTSEKLNWN